MILNYLWRPIIPLAPLDASLVFKVSANCSMVLAPPAFPWTGLTYEDCGLELLAVAGLPKTADENSL